MTTTRAVQMIGRPVFTTREIAALRGSSVSAASQGLKRMERSGLLTLAARGIWCVPTDPRFTRFSLVPFLFGSHPAYVSFVSALHLHGLIAQIPQVVYAATTGHTRTVRTSVGSFSFHRIEPGLFFGFDWYGERRDFLIAVPEKALIDSLYLSGRKGRRFSFFPELEMNGFDFGLARKWIRRIGDPRIRKFTLERLESLR